MATPVDYVTEAKALNEKVGSKVPMLIATVIMVVISGVVPGVVGGIVPITLPLFMAIGAMLQTLLLVSLIKMAARIRKGEAVNFMDVLNVQSFLVPGLLLGAAAAAVNLLGYLAMVVSIFGLIAKLCGILLSMALVWAPYDMALKNNTFMEAWMASVNFWKKDPVNVLLFLILGVIFSIVQGLVVFAPGIGFVAFLMYYQDKTGMQAFQPSAAAAQPAMAGAK